MNEERGISAGERAKWEKLLLRGQVSPLEFDIHTKCIVRVQLGNEATERFHLLVELKNVSTESATVYKELTFDDIGISITKLDGTEARWDLLRIGIPYRIVSFRDTVEIASGASRYYEFKQDIDWLRRLSFGEADCFVESGQTYQIQILLPPRQRSNVIEWTVSDLPRTETAV